MHPVDLDVFAFPVSLLLGMAFVLFVYVLHKYARANRVVALLSGKPAAIVALAVVSVFMAIEGVWAVGVVHSPVFVLVVGLFIGCVGMAFLEGLRGRRSPCSLLCHGGIFLVLFASYFGAPDVRKMKVALRGGAEPVTNAYYLDGTLAPLPFSVSLNAFETDYYEDGQLPRQFTSALSVDGHEVRTSVNHPCRYEGYTFFQDGYNGAYSVIGIHCDPWLPLVYIGMALLAVGCVKMLAGRWKMTVMLPAVLVIAAAFTVVSVVRIRFGTLMPALRSLWFVPHLVAYMVAYALMSIALIVGVFRGLRSAVAVNRMVRMSSALIAVGMLCGSVWARQAWGDYWAWDPKECLAAVTWLITVVYIHIGENHRKIRLAVLGAAFIALQFTWYGVNLLPSAGNSLHTYMSE